MSNVSPREPAPLPRPGEHAGWLLVFGDRCEHRAVLHGIDRAEAERRAVSVHGVLYETVVRGPRCGIECAP